METLTENKNKWTENRSKECVTIMNFYKVQGVPLFLIHINDLLLATNNPIHPSIHNHAVCLTRGTQISIQY